MPFKLTDKQREAETLAKSDAEFLLFMGGSRAGKTFAICYFIFIRAMITPNSRHAILRKTAVEARSKLFELTFPQMMEAHSPGLWSQLRKDGQISKDPMRVQLPNGSVILFDGLDDGTREDRILGDEFSSVFISEITQFATFDIIEQVMSRLSLELPTEYGATLAPKLFLDCNPTTERHWGFAAFDQKLNPISREPWPDPDKWASIQMNPADNMDHLSERYIEKLKNLTARKRQRFLYGEWQSDNDNAMFQPIWINDNRKEKRDPEACQDLTRIIVAIDPAGTSHAGSDETGIIAAGIDEDGHVHILEDGSGKYTPDQWARKAEALYTKWSADNVIAEKNFGADMVVDTLRVRFPNLPVKAVNASRGKTIRAEPVASLYELGKVHHCGTFEKLEGQLEDFKIDFDRKKNGSPDRLDALVWAVSELAVTAQQSRGGHSQQVTGFWR